MEKKIQNGLNILEQINELSKFPSSLFNIILEYYFGPIELKLKIKWGKKGNGNNGFTSPYQICCNNKYIVISDYGNHCIKIFDLNGNFINLIECDSPIGITIYNNLIYVCPIYSTIHVFTFDGILHLKTSIKV